MLGPLAPRVCRPAARVLRRRNQSTMRTATAADSAPAHRSRRRRLSGRAALRLGARAPTPNAAAVSGERTVTRSSGVGSPHPVVAVAGPRWGSSASGDQMLTGVHYGPGLDFHQRGEGRAFL